MSARPLAIDLYCGLGGWTEGLLAEGYDVIGFDIEQHVYGEHRYPAQLVIQDVLTLHGSQFKSAALIVASPPCQAYSYRAMPWSRARALPPPDNSLFEACFRIQREASEAAGRHVPLVVENVRGAQKWVGRARWNFGSFYLWGDVPALMPPISAIKNNGGSWFAIAHNTTSGKGQNPDGRKLPNFRSEINAGATSHWTNPAEHRKLPGFRFDGSGRSFQSASVEGVKVASGGSGLEAIDRHYGGYERNHPNAFGWKSSRLTSKSPARKMASAMIAKIPLALARHIAAVYRPLTDGVRLGTAQ